MLHPTLRAIGRHATAPHILGVNEPAMTSILSVYIARCLLIQESAPHRVGSTHAGCRLEREQGSPHKATRVLLAASLVVLLAGSAAVPHAIALLLSCSRQLSP